MRTCIIFATLALAVALTVPAMAAEPNVATPASPEVTKLARGPYKPNWKSLQQYRCPDWFRDAKFGIWAHWGPQAVPRQGDWYARNMYVEGSDDYKHHLATYGHPSKSGYKDIIPLWKADKWEPDRLMELYRKAGARYFVAQAVHCDNFDLWDSKFHRWNAVQLGPKRDMVGTWKQAALKQGMRFGVSEHLGYSRCWFQTSHGADKTGPLAGVPYDGADPRWRTLYHPTDPLDCCRYSNAPDWQSEWFNRIEDLVDHYQADLLYSDGGIPFGEVGRSLVAHFYNENIRKHGGQLGAVYTCKLMHDSGDFMEGVSVQDVERGAMREIQPLPWQTDTSNGDWYFRENDHYKTADQVIRLLADIVSKNGNMLLNIVQYPDGSLPPESAKLLEELAAWMSINGEAIHGTRPWKLYGEGPTVVAGGHFKEDFPFSARDIRFTTKDGNLYAIAMGWPADGKLTIRSLATPNAIKSVTLLGHAGTLAWKQTDKGMEITLPQQKVSDIAIAFEIIGENLQPTPIPVDVPAKGADTSPRPRTPIMGWSSWNHFHINISEVMIRGQADAMVASGMKKAGYRYINTDDGYFGGRDKNGKLFCNKDKFPSGMKALANYIHAKGLKAGIYGEAGADTCGCQWDNDPHGFGVGLYQHEEQDLGLMLKEWGYDFIKVDWCGGLRLKLSEEKQYTLIGGIVRRLRPDVVYNVCRWQYPGDWVKSAADSWRISGDISATFDSVMHIVDQCEPLWVHCRPGHFNDMDMLQVGRGMTADEDKAHFTMWCMMNSPLLAGNDLRNMNAATIAILTQPEIIALNQDPLCYQARRLRKDGGSELWAKPLETIDGGEVAVTLLNRSKQEVRIAFNLSDVGIDAAMRYSLRDLWQRKTLATATTDTSRSFMVPVHSVVVLRIKGLPLANNPFK